MCCCCKKYKCDKHVLISCTGLSLSIFEMILASSYNFHEIGFGLSIVGIVVSSLYLHLYLKQQRIENEKTNTDNEEENPINNSASGVNT